MSDIAEAIQKLTPEQKKFFNKKLEEGMAGLVKKFEEEIKKYEEGPYVIFKGKKLQKNLRQFIPYTEEGWKKEMEKQKRYKTAKDRENLTNFIDKVFFEDGALHLEKRAISV